MKFEDKHNEIVKEGFKFNKKLDSAVNINDKKKFIDSLMNIYDSLEAAGQNAFGVKLYLKQLIDAKLNF